MKVYTFPKRNRMGSVLAALPLALLLVLASFALKWVTIPYGFIPMQALALAMAGASVLLASWTLMHNRPGNFYFSPLPKLGCIFVSTGPYRWIRHPMYSSLLLGTGALALTSSPFFGWVAWAVLTFILVLTSIIEEHWMKEKHPGYSYYIQDSKRFLPGIF